MGDLERKKRANSLGLPHSPRQQFLKSLYRNTHSNIVFQYGDTQGLDDDDGDDSEQSFHLDHKDENSTEGDAQHDESNVAEALGAEDDASDGTSTVIIKDVPPDIPVEVDRAEDKNDEAMCDKIIASLHSKETLENNSSFGAEDIDFGNKGRQCLEQLINTPINRFDRCMLNTEYLAPCMSNLESVVLLLKENSGWEWHSSIPLPVMSFWEEMAVSSRQDITDHDSTELYLLMNNSTLSEIMWKIWNYVSAGEDTISKSQYISFYSDLYRVLSLCSKDEAVHTAGNAWAIDSLGAEDNAEVQGRIEPKVFQQIVFELIVIFSRSVETERVCRMANVILEAVQVSHGLDDSLFRHIDDLLHNELEDMCHNPQDTPSMGADTPCSLPNTAKEMASRPSLVEKGNLSYSTRAKDNLNNAEALKPKFVPFEEMTMEGNGGRKKASSTPGALFRGPSGYDKKMVEKIIHHSPSPSVFSRMVRPKTTQPYRVSHLDSRRRTSSRSSTRASKTNTPSSSISGRQPFKHPSRVIRPKRPATALSRPMSENVTAEPPERPKSAGAHVRWVNFDRFGADGNTAPKPDDESMKWEIDNDPDECISDYIEMSKDEVEDDPLPVGDVQERACGGSVTPRKISRVRNPVTIGKGTEFHVPISEEIHKCLKAASMMPKKSDTGANGYNDRITSWAWGRPVSRVPTPLLTPRTDRSGASSPTLKSGRTPLRPHSREGSFMGRHSRQGSFTGGGHSRQGSMSRRHAKQDSLNSIDFGNLVDLPSFPQEGLDSNGSISRTGNSPHDRIHPPSPSRDPEKKRRPNATRSHKIISLTNRIIPSRQQCMSAEGAVQSERDPSAVTSGVTASRKSVKKNLAVWRMGRKLEHFVNEREAIAIEAGDAPSTQEATIETETDSNSSKQPFTGMDIPPDTPESVPSLPEELFLRILKKPEPPKKVTNWELEKMEEARIHEDAKSAMQELIAETKPRTPRGCPESYIPGNLQPEILNKEILTKRTSKKARRKEDRPRGSMPGIIESLLIEKGDASTLRFEQASIQQSYAEMLVKHKCDPQKMKKKLESRNPLIRAVAVHSIAQTARDTLSNEFCLDTMITALSDLNVSVQAAALEELSQGTVSIDGNEVDRRRIIHLLKAGLVSKEARIRLLSINALARQATQESFPRDIEPLLADGTDIVVEAAMKAVLVWKCTDLVKSVVRTAMMHSSRPAAAETGRITLVKMADLKPDIRKDIVQAINAEAKKLGNHGAVKLRASEIIENLVGATAKAKKTARAVNSIPVVG